MQRPLRPRTFWPVVRAAGLLPMAITFAVLFVLASMVVAANEPAVGDFGNAAWFLFTVVTTIGLGDYTCASVIGRVVTVLLSAYSVFFIALITGAVVSYCTERLKARRDASVAAFLDKLERLPELSHEELVEISERVKRM